MTVQGMGDLRLPAPGKDWLSVGWTDSLRGLDRNGPEHGFHEGKTILAEGRAETVLPGAVGVGVRGPVAGDAGGCGKPGRGAAGSIA